MSIILLTITVFLLFNCWILILYFILNSSVYETVAEEGLLRTSGHCVYVLCFGSLVLLLVLFTKIKEFIQRVKEAQKQYKNKR